MPSSRASLVRALISAVPPLWSLWEHSSVAFPLQPSPSSHRLSFCLYRRIQHSSITFCQHQLFCKRHLSRR
ncbi:hypothetical protein PGIGA_G00260920 [Pangasianodon gigas]|uniref:Uncharacterized protein n=1 Tax=Pangasianodon gigas TaxID=30993 RepID=A0ACC5WTJ7_PANGG|nr:hypothetical protein [Pangasianodon gigas]